MTHDIAAQPALLTGAASVVRKADKDALALKATPAILRATIQITRAETGVVEEYEITGTKVEGENDVVENLEE